MGNLALALLLFALGLAMAAAHGKGEGEDWREILGLGKAKVTRLHFYFHDMPSGKDPSAVRVAQATSTDKSPTAFGAVAVVDDPLTEGASPNSKLVGRAQGLYAFAGQQDFGLLMVIDYGFTEGKYKGSSLSICGMNRVTNPVREMPIVGGTGYFRFARGTAIARTYLLNSTTGYTIVGYNVTVIHY